MKRNLSLIILLLFPLIVFSQKTKVTVLTDDADITLNGILVGSTIKLSEDKANGFVVVAKKGNVTYGEKNEDLLKKGIMSTINLTPVKKPAGGVKSKKIEFVKFLDAANLSRATVSYTPYGAYTSGGFDLDDQIYIKPIPKLMGEWGYTMIGSNSVFDVKDDAPELVLAGEVINFGKDTRGSGFQVSILVNWSLLEVETKKVIYNGIIGGFSDSKKEIGIKEEFILALKDATVGLMSDPKFTAVALRTEESSGSASSGLVTTLPKIAPPKAASYSEVVKSTVGSVVTIKNGNSFGSGFVISKSGYILTNNHVVTGRDTFEVIFSNGFNMEGILIKRDNVRDVALLKISGSGYTPLAINTSFEELEVGTEVIAIGTPEDIKLNQTVTKGIISGKRELEDDYKRKSTFIQTDVTINRGNSGGPLLNMKGEVVGIIMFKVAGKVTEGLGFAIPIGEAVEKLNVKFQ